MSNTNFDTVDEFAGKDKLGVMAELTKTREVLAELLQALVYPLHNEERFVDAEIAARELLRACDALHQKNRGYDIPLIPMSKARRWSIAICIGMVSACMFGVLLGATIVAVCR